MTDKERFKELQDGNHFTSDGFILILEALDEIIEKLDNPMIKIEAPQCNCVGHQDKYPSWHCDKHGHMRT